ncbi:MAG: c-type cytochrome [Micropepsaceae bacterium]
MKRTALILGLVLMPALSNAQSLPSWIAPAAQDDISEEMLNAVRAGDQAARDVAYPAIPLSVPAVVREGLDGNGTCMGCHTTTGRGVPQSAPLAGLPPAYFVQQIVNFRTGARGQAYRPNMANFAGELTIEQTMEIANYYASLPVEPLVDVVESEMVPRTFVGPRDITVVHPDGGEEPLGERIVELAKTPAAPYTNGVKAFTAHVPVGSIAQGRELAERGLGKTVSCGLCHGADLQGNGDIPGIAGRSPLHNARQLMEYRDGLRGGDSAQPMLGVAENLTNADIIAIAAYVASLPPI